MASTTVGSPAAAGGSALLIRLGAAWHALLAVGLALAAWSLLQTSWAQRDGLRPVAAGLVVLAAVASAAAAALLLRRDGRGRAISLGLNYVLGVGSLLTLLGVLGLYTGLDAVAAAFYRWAWLLVGVLVGFLVGGIGDRYAHAPATQAAFHRVGNWIMAGTALIMLLAMGLVQGLLFMLGGLANPLAVGLLAATLLFGGAFWLMLRPQTAAAFGAGERDAEAVSGFLFIAPNLLGFLLFFAGPLLFSLFLSFTDSDSFTANFVGLRNYIDIFSLQIVQAAEGQRGNQVLSQGFIELTRIGNTVIGAKDRVFWIALWNTIVYCFWVTILSVLPALLVANILNSKIPGMQFFRAVYFIPSIAGVVGVAVIWKWLYNSNVGFLNYGINQLIGLVNWLPGVQIAPVAIPWLASEQTALGSIIIMAAWQLLGFNTILFLAGLQGVPGEVYEAATIDGASTWQRFRYMTLPLLAPTTFFVVTTTLIATLQVFSEPFVMTPPPGGGPNNSTMTAVLYLYQLGFNRFAQGYAAAVAWVVFLFIFAVTIVQFRLQRRYGEM
ncbi:MAG TPA: sugar ABC transporter permease [Chloroflexaceae bacterium]|nr:sugar ABC transporter permease [Chloroflexaceae bacterium]